MIQGIIFSKDRALQLDATLKSFLEHCKNVEHVKLTVLYKTTDKIHAGQYMALQKTYSNVQFINQCDFRRDVFKFLNPYSDGSLAEGIYKTLLAFSPRLAAAIAYWMPRLLEQKFILFLVDDNLFVRDFDIDDAVTVLQENPDAVGFSLRLGRNTTYCYVLDRPQALPNFAHLKGYILKYQWTSAEEDFGYPFEISSSIYRLWDFLPILLGLRFDNPNLLEGHMAGRKKLFARILPALLCFETSVTFCNPINKVQNVFDNLAGIHYHYSPQELAELFDEGYRISIKSYSNFVPNSCHQEVELALEKPHD